MGFQNSLIQPPSLLGTLSRIVVLFFIMTPPLFFEKFLLPIKNYFNLINFKDNIEFFSNGTGPLLINMGQHLI